MTGQTLLNLMEMCDRELQLQTGEVDVTRGLIALNVAQDQFETILATFPNAGGSIGTVSTSSGIESTAFPTGVIRIDRLQFIDPATSLPAWDIVPLKRTGGQLWNRSWPLYITTSPTAGRPTGYWEDHSNIYWTPVPDGTHTVRWYGLQRASDITAGGTFAYDDAIAYPLAATAAKLMKIGLEDDASVLGSVANEFLVPAVRALDRHNRDGGTALIYSRGHDA